MAKLTFYGGINEIGGNKVLVEDGGRLFLDFGFRGFGLLLEMERGWQIPDAEKGLRASGHACGSDPIRMAREIKPEILIPVHSEHPNLYLTPLRVIGISVTLPVLGQTLEL